MLLVLQRKVMTPASTIGEITIDGNHECYSLELPVKDGLPGSAIPPGIFPVTLSPSPKFQLSNDPWVMKYADFIPHINNIPNRSTILIHHGNGPHDTDGCILVGQTIGEDFIGASRAAFSALHAKLTQAIGLGQTIELDVRLTL
jgi:hypothetical protein